MYQQRKVKSVDSQNFFAIIFARFLFLEKIVIFVHPYYL